MKFKNEAKDEEEERRRGRRKKRLRTMVVSGSHDQLLAVKSRINTQKSVYVRNFFLMKNKYLSFYILLLVGVKYECPEVGEKQGAGKDKKKDKRQC